MYTPSMIAAASVAAALHGLDWTGKSGYGLARLLDELTRITAIEQVSNVRIRRVWIANWKIAPARVHDPSRFTRSYDERDVSRRSVFKFFKPAVRRRTPPVARRRLASGARRRRGRRNRQETLELALRKSRLVAETDLAGRKKRDGKCAGRVQQVPGTCSRARGRRKKMGGPECLRRARCGPRMHTRRRRRRDRHSVSFPFPLAFSFLSFLSTFLSSFLSLYMPSTNKPREWMRLCMRSVTRKRNIFNHQSSSACLEPERVRKTSSSKWYPAFLDFHSWPRATDCTLRKMLLLEL